ncbi:CinA family protein [Salinibacterium sp. dk2585]|uniref:CinA family protein n=1 Tax=unclassified Salinibacterium TaxID=2632331 RepID=UPI0011C2456B|nr:MULTISPECIES: CinA family protein [unclassified Salinibacterium]QEE61661.1 CinA family protein [Salinibacterium sp. dk2585]TXK54787.1 CinA family protein [Salinibacterium sp. dk5596]
MTASRELVELLIERRLTIAIAESLTGGLVVSDLIATPGASATVLGGVVAYNTELKRSVLGVDASILNVHGAVHPDVAGQMASLVRDVLAVDGVPADIGVSTTGVAGPDWQDGRQPGTVFIGVAIGSDLRVSSHEFEGDRDAIRRQAADAAVLAVLDRLR